MKKISMNKFLELSFKAGKILSSVSLVVVILVILGAGIGLLTTTNQKLETPEFKTLGDGIQEIIDSDEEQTEQPRNYKPKDSLEKYNKQIDKIIKDNDLIIDIKKDIKNSLLNVPEKYRNQYLNGLDEFYEDGLKQLNKSPKMMDTYLLFHVKREVGYYYVSEYTKARINPKNDEVYNKYLCNGLLYDYNIMFENSLDDVEQDKISNTQKRITLASVLGSSFLLFVILLFLPVLIKIEENTRPEKSEPVEEQQQDDTKTCPHCGKTIKLSAKKCRYCNQWLEGDQE